MKLSIDKCMVFTVTLKSNPIKKHSALYITKVPFQLTQPSISELQLIPSCLSMHMSIPHVRKQTQHCHFSAKTADLVREKSSSLLILTYVNPILEYAVSVWVLHTRCTMDDIRNDVDVKK